MAISATFSKTNKKINSTKLPVAAADDITLSVELKDVTNLFTPSLVISADTFMSGGQIVMDGTPTEIFTRGNELRELGLDVPVL